MSHAILSVKLHELDEKIARMCSRIQLSQCAMRGRLTQEISALEQECAETDLILQERLKFSRAGVVTALSAAYEKIELVR